MYVYIEIYIECAFLMLCKKKMKFGWPSQRGVGGGGGVAYGGVVGDCTIDSAFKLAASRFR